MYIKENRMIRGKREPFQPNAEQNKKKKFSDNLRTIEQCVFNKIGLLGI